MLGSRAGQADHKMFEYDLSKQVHFRDPSTVHFAPTTADAGLLKSLFKLVVQLVQNSPGPTQACSDMAKVLGPLVLRHTDHCVKRDGPLEMQRRFTASVQAVQLLIRCVSVSQGCESLRRRRRHSRPHRPTHLCDFRPSCPPCFWLLVPSAAPLGRQVIDKHKL